MVQEPGHEQVDEALLILSTDFEFFMFAATSGVVVHDAN